MDTFKPDTNNLLNEVKDTFGSKIMKNFIYKDLLTIDIISSDVFEVVDKLKNNKHFNFLTDISGVDYLDYSEKQEARFAVIYLFTNMQTRSKIKIRAFIKDDENPTIDSIQSLFHGANWLEREIYDMFGIFFNNHPNLERILMPENYGSNPLRKDYPLKGLGERTNFPDYKTRKNDDS